MREKYNYDIPTLLYAPTKINDPSVESKFCIVPKVNMRLLLLYRQNTAPQVSADIFIEMRLVIISLFESTAKMKLPDIA